ncbi:hypothetical protein K491DRAFT_709884 [Lophiostoma macrostomum CBS 122681]|uniref:Uncharacterized protein n=1 Tax=Lophiostoma macrostomum CBS 122681 TaxID=1314788 RepID=A0A6A6TRV4_9PLEO|nr:hypothetical protein K491DRAFT_709884 [Lophiostoma macrostomum CBS 122681]
MEERGSVHHVRDLSFHVTYSSVEVERIAREVYDETIAEVHLSLFIFWISESPKHYEQAKEYIRIPDSPDREREAAKIAR